MRPSVTERVAEKFGATPAGWIAEACTRSLHEHRPVKLTEVRL